MRRLFDAIPLDQVTTSMTINSTAPILLALYLVVAEEQGVAWSKVGGTVQNDILKEYAARGTYIYPPGPSLKLVTDVIAFCADRVPKWNPISISGYHIREAGSTAVQEVAFTLANGLAYVDAALERGLAIDDFAPRLSFFFNAHNDFLEEVAKFRAARRLWAELLTRALRPQGPALALAALPHPDRRLDAHRAAARQQRGAGRDPGAGRGLRRHPVAAHQRPRRGARPAHRGLGAASRCAPSRSSRTRAASPTYADPLGGIVGDRGGRPSASCAKRASTSRASTPWAARAPPSSAASSSTRSRRRPTRTQRAIEKGEQVIVGVNRYGAAVETPHEVLEIDPRGESEQVERLRAVRAGTTTRRAPRRRSTRCDATPSRNANLMPAILDCVRAEVTLGEISNALREIYGEHRDEQMG